MSTASMRHTSALAMGPLRSIQSLTSTQAANDLVFKGLAQPNCHTEPLLHAWRLKVKEG